MKFLRAGLAALVVGLVVLYVRTLDWTSIADSTRGASFALLALGIAGNLPLIWLKALRLRSLVGGRIGTGRLMGFFVASYAADNLVMSQAGLGLRVALLHREGLPIASAAAVQGLEKLLEGVGLAVIALPLVFAADLAPWLASALHVCLLVGAAATLALVVLVVMSRREIPALRRLRETLDPLRDLGVTAWVGLLTLAAWSVELAIVAATLSALHLPTGLPAAVTVLVAVNVAALVPGLPANLGSFEMAAVVALGTFAVAREPATGFAIVYHAAHTIPVTVLGLIGFQRAMKVR